MPRIPDEPAADRKGTGSRPVGSEPGTEPVGFEPGTEPVGSEPGTEPVGSEPGTEPVGFEPGTEPVEFKPGTDPFEPRVRLTDARSLRAFAHPLRVKLMAALRSYGPLTATQAAAYVGDTPSNCSFHLRSLGSFGVIEQAAGPNNRSRPWRTVPGSVSFDPDDSAESRAAWEAASDVLHASQMDELATWIGQQPEPDQGWRNAWFDLNVTAPMTADELARLRKQVASLLQPFVDRRNARQEAGEPVVRDDERPVRAITIGFPAPPARRGATAPELP